jgi:hypothetical protein
MVGYILNMAATRFKRLQLALVGMIPMTEYPFTMKFHGKRQTDVTKTNDAYCTRRIRILIACYHPIFSFQTLLASTRYDAGFQSAYAYCLVTALIFSKEAGTDAAT